jgi:serine/threonine protein kinase
MNPPDTIPITIDDLGILNIPTRFDRYEYVKLLGRGSSGVVILVRHLVTLTLFACKVISRQYLTENNLADRFEQELRY